MSDTRHPGEKCSAFVLLCVFFGSRRAELSWGLLAVSVVVNWGAGLLMEKEREADDRKKASVDAGMMFWLGI